MSPIFRSFSADAGKLLVAAVHIHVRAFSFSISARPLYKTSILFFCFGSSRECTGNRDISPNNSIVETKSDGPAVSLLAFTASCNSGSICVLGCSKRTFCKCGGDMRGSVPPRQTSCGSLHLCPSDRFLRPQEELQINHFETVLLVKQHHIRIPKVSGYPLEQECLPLVCHCFAI